MTNLPDGVTHADIDRYWGDDLPTEISNDIIRLQYVMEHVDTLKAAARMAQMRAQTDDARANLSAFIMALDDITTDNLVSAVKVLSNG
jgi:hypothetical protein